MQRRDGRAVVGAIKSSITDPTVATENSVVRRETFSGLPLPPELWAHILHLAASSLSNLAELASVNRTARTLAWDSPSSKAGVLLRLHGDEQAALLHIQSFGFLPDAAEIASCLFRQRSRSARSADNCGSSNLCAGHSSYDCPLRWVLFSTSSSSSSSLSLSSPLSSSTTSSAPRRRRHHPVATPRPPLPWSHRETLAARLLTHLTPLEHGDALLLPATRAASPAPLALLINRLAPPPLLLARCLRQAIQFGRTAQASMLAAAGALTPAWATEHGADALVQCVAGPLGDNDDDDGAGSPRDDAEDTANAVAELLMDHGVEASARAVEAAAGLGRERAVRMLLARGAACTAAAVRSAVRGRHAGVLRAVIEAARVPRQRMRVVAPERETLETAVTLRNAEMVGLVLEMARVTGASWLVSEAVVDARIRDGEDEEDDDDTVVVAPSSPSWSAASEAPSSPPISASTPLRRRPSSRSSTASSETVSAGPSSPAAEPSSPAETALSSPVPSRSSTVLGDATTLVDVVALHVKPSTLPTASMMLAPWDPVSLAAFDGLPEILGMLVEAGVAVPAVAVERARRAGRAEIADYLEKVRGLRCRGVQAWE
ncbi:hypothetical protein HDU96_004591 [Phlyctochytrium bullatum]|nr:hypothetical protein HDU96_004591 [Phlyctochytrium bullatum]